MKSNKNTLFQNRKRRITAKVRSVSVLPRLIVHRSNQHISGQLINLDGTIIASQTSEAWKGSKDSGIVMATKVGQELAKKIISAKVENIVFDRRGYRYHGRVKALAEAVRQAGIKF
jgi:large subunit ribosomal protein L18